MLLKYIKFIFLCILASAGVTLSPLFASDTLRISYHNDSIFRSPEVYSLKWEWSVYPGPDFTRPDFKDDHFPVTTTQISPQQLRQLNPDLKPMWFRIYLKADSSATGQPIGFRINAIGNAQFYFDGKQLKNLRYEKHKDKDRDRQCFSRSSLA